MSATTTRSDVRTRVRDYLYEATADLITDAQLNRLYSEELHSLPKKDIYNEELWTTTTVQNQIEYSLPAGTEKIEKIQINEGTTDIPEWVDLRGWTVYADTLLFNFLPNGGDTIKAFIKKRFTIPTDDSTAVDMDDSMIEVVVWGIVCRAYRILIGYLRDSRNWDSISKPDGVSLQAVSGWLRDAERHYKELISQYATTPIAREIDMVS